MTVTADQILDQVMLRVPERYLASRELFSAIAADLAYIINSAELDWIPTVTIGGSEGQWLTLLARGYGVDRASGETDIDLRSRLRSIGEALTKNAILDAVNSILVSRGTAVPAIMTEHFVRQTVLDTSVVDFAFVLDRSYLVDTHNSFILIVPDFGDLTDSVYASIIAEVNRIRASGISWSLIVIGAP